VDPSEESLPEVVREMTDGLGADIAFDCSARQETLNDALDSVRCQGRVVVMGDKGECAITPGRQVMYRETEVIGSLYFDRADVPGMLDLYRRGLPVDELVTHRFPLEDADEAFKTFASGESGKVLIVQQGA
jgi:threonine dehydrogenase-like Zn-dependent dehydrogenase